MTPIEQPLLDSSALTALLLQEPGADRIEAVLAAANKQRVAPLSLEFARAECLNAIWKNSFLLKKITEQQARAAIDAIDGITLEMVPVDGYLMGKAFAMSVTNRISTYDTLFIMGASTRGATLVTMDDRQARVAKQYVNVLKVSASPEDDRQTP